MEVLRRGTEPHGCGETLKGPRMALVSRPPEQRRSEGSLAAGQARMPGWPRYFLLARQEIRSVAE